MKFFKINLVLPIMAALLSGCTYDEVEDPEPLRVAFISHTYYVNRHPDMQKMIVEEINAANVKYVFSLGDIVLLNYDHLWKKTLDFFSRFQSKVYFSPGNHDIFNFDVVEGLATDRHYPEWRQQYIDRIGYAQTMVIDDQADFVLVNSNDPFFKVKPFLDESLEKADPETPTLLLAHHRIWLERYQKSWVNWYAKSTKKEEFLPYISKFDQLVIGDVWGKLEHKIIEDTPVAMIGMGNHDKPAFWVLAELQKDGTFKYEEKVISLPEGHPYIHY